MKRAMSACIQRAGKGLDYQFASDNTTGCHSQVMEAMQMANSVSAPPYGDCEFSKTASTMLKTELGLKEDDAHVRFVASGTGGNVLCLSMACSRPYHSIIVSECAHVANYTVGVCENIIGCKVNIINENKITAPLLNKLLESSAVYPEYSSIPKVVSLTQPTEYGDVYTIQEMNEIKEIAKKFNIFIHVDGARIASACVALSEQMNKPSEDILKEICEIADLVTFGGAKNGLGTVEAVVIKKNVCESIIEVKAAMKQIGLVVSKTRLLSSQFIAYLSDKLWLSSAEASHKAALNLFRLIESKTIKSSPPVTNQLFVTISKSQLTSLQTKFAVYPWGDETEDGNIPIRIVTSWNTSEEACSQFCDLL